MDFYRECGREISLSFTTLHNLDSIRVAILVAAAGFFGVTNGTNGTPTVAQITSLLVLVVIWLASVRLLVRSCLVYGNLLRFNHLQKVILLWSSADSDGRGERETFSRDFRTYFLNWRSKESKWRILHENLKLGGGYYLFGLGGLAMSYRTFELRSCGGAQALAILVVAATSMEAVLFSRTSALRRESDPKPRMRGRALCWLVVVFAVAGITEVLNRNPFGGAC